jgi:hypothetical protein
MCAQAFSAERAPYGVRLGGGERKNLLATRTDSVQLFTVKEVRVVSWPTGRIARCGRRGAFSALVKITKETDAESRNTYTVVLFDSIPKSPKSRVGWKLHLGTGRNQGWDRCFRGGCGGNYKKMEYVSIVLRRYWREGDRHLTVHS